VFALAVSVSLQVLGIGGISALIVLVIAFIPQLLVSFVIVVAGHLTGLIARNLVARFVDGITPESLVPRLAYGAILAVAIVMALQHLNVNISFITQLFLILVTIIGGGLMLAFALGARQYVANLLARRDAERFAIGQRIRIDGLEGDVVDIHATAVDIATDEGIASIPASRFAESVVIRRPDQSDDG